MTTIEIRNDNKLFRKLGACSVKFSTHEEPFVALAKHHVSDKFVAMLRANERLVLTDITIQALPDDVYFIVFTAIAVPNVIVSID